jgi:hypothetical protein
LSGVRYLSLEWIDAIGARAAADPAVQVAAEGITIGVTQVVTDGPEGTVVYSLQVEDGKVSFSAGAAYPEHVRFEQSWETATQVATGELNAQQAFMDGRILLTGDPQRLTESQPVFGALNDVFDAVRADTEYR